MLSSYSAIIDPLVHSKLLMLDYTITQRSMAPHFTQYKIISKNNPVVLSGIAQKWSN